MPARTLLLLISIALSAPAVAVAAPKGLGQIEHFVVIYLENRSFDSLFGRFPGADGLKNAEHSPPQVDEFGNPYPTLPPVFAGGQIDKRFPADLANRPFDIGDYLPPQQKHPDLTHRFFINQMQINGGRNDRYAQLSSAGGLVMGHYHLPDSALWRYAKQFTLADHFFQAAFGGSFLNHQWLICACTPEFKQAPNDMRLWKNDPANGKPIADPSISEDGYAVGTLQPFYPPHDNTPEQRRLPPQYQPTIGDRLSAKNISWAWYAGGWDDVLAKRDNGENFQYHHHPFVYYANYAPGSPARAEHLKDKAQLFADLQDNFPQVVFFKPVGVKNQHPGYTNIEDADREVEEVVEAIRGSAIWPSTAIIITYDENGGFWDHAAPPRLDRWGPGTRVPAIIVSPFAKKGYIDHSVYDTTSILKLLETRFELEPLGSRDAQANAMLNAFNFSGGKIGKSRRLPIAGSRHGNAPAGENPAPQPKEDR